MGECSCLLRFLIISRWLICIQSTSHLTPWKVNDGKPQPYHEMFVLNIANIKREFFEHQQSHFHLPRDLSESVMKLTFD